MGSMKQIATSIEDGKFIDYRKMTDQELVQTVAHNSRLLATHGDALGRYVQTLQGQQEDAKRELDDRFDRRLRKMRRFIRGR